ncbi:hypothetical protein F4693_002657 [Sphingomonas endophytica]|uniref:Uncharacterized protein n=2 Tax=Sphingomonas endophytica TaxID=869719 RepID=A0A7X0JFF5_9SPHN|nr:hypothetical protein [Sphingomonas endophytica]
MLGLVPVADAAGQSGGVATTAGRSPSCGIDPAALHWVIVGDWQYLHEQFRDTAFANRMVVRAKSQRPPAGGHRRIARSHGRTDASRCCRVATKPYVPT